MSDADQPPEAIWLDDEALSEHFQRVRERYASPSGTSTADDVAPLEQNELTRGLRA